MNYKGVEAFLLSFIMYIHKLSFNKKQQPDI